MLPKGDAYERIYKIAKGMVRKNIDYYVGEDTANGEIIPIYYLRRPSNYHSQESRIEMFQDQRLDKHCGCIGVG